MLKDKERVRFERQLVLEGVGEEGQERLKVARVLVIGAGGLGSSACLYLAAAGVGTLGLVDFDHVTLSNLNRQILHGVADLGRKKTRSAADRLQAFAPDVQVVQHPETLTARRAAELVDQYDLVVECSDTFETKFLVNAACVERRIPLVWASVLAWEGQMSVMMPGAGPCYRCLFPPEPKLDQVPAAWQVGILGGVAGAIGALEAVEAIKVLVEAGQPLVGRLLIYDGFTASFEEVSFAPNPTCPVCGGGGTG
jgi:adenylyltransferase/sulfurtransferase